MDKRGAVLALSLGLMAFITTLGAAFLIRSLNEDRLGLQDGSRQTAFYLAEAGVDQASLNLRTPTNPADDILTAALPTGTFLIDAPVLLGVNLWQVTAHGTSGNSQRAIEVVYQLMPQSVFQYAVFGDQTVSVSGSAATDSYDSNAGPYDPTTAGSNGDIGTNATTAGGIAVGGGNYFIDGQIVVGPGVANPASVITGNYNPALVTGDPKVASQPNAFPMPPVTVNTAAFTAVLNDGDGDCADYTVAGSTTVTLSPTGGLNGTGEYCYRNLTIQGNATFTTSGSVTVSLVGALTARGNSTVGVENDPANMLFQMSSTASATLEEGEITGSNNFYGALYGPAATITIRGNAEVFGSIIAKNINVTGSANIHYDEALANVNTISNTYRRAVVSWRDLN